MRIRRVFLSSLVISILPVLLIVCYAVPSFSSVDTSPIAQTTTLTTQTSTISTSTTTTTISTSTQTSTTSTTTTTVTTTTSTSSQTSTTVTTQTHTTSTTTRTTTTSTSTTIVVTTSTAVGTYTSYYFTVSIPASIYIFITSSSTTSTTATVTSTSISTVITTTTSTNTLTITTTTQRRCVIASAAYGSDLAAPVQFLREFRDEKLRSTMAGTEFMKAFDAFYYSFSPAVASVVAENPTISELARAVMNPLIYLLHAGSIIFQFISFSPELAAVISGTFASALFGVVYVMPVLLFGKMLKAVRSD